MKQKCSEKEKEKRKKGEKINKISSNYSWVKTERMYEKHSRHKYLNCNSAAGLDWSSESNMEKIN